MRFNIILLVLLMTIAQASFAADIQPGLWKLTMETQVAASPDLSPAPYTTSQCLTEQDAQDPSRVFGSAANPGVSDCTFTEKQFFGSTFRFQMQCADTPGMKTRGEINYTTTTMEANIVSTGNWMGQTTEIQSKVTARRLGGC